MIRRTKYFNVTISDQTVKFILKGLNVKFNKQIAIFLALFMFGFKAHALEITPLQISYAQFGGDPQGSYRPYTEIFFTNSELQTMGFDITDIDQTPRQLF